MFLEHFAYFTSTSYDGTNGLVETTRIYHISSYIYIYDIGTKAPIGLNSFWTRVQTGPGYRIGDAYEKITVICNSILISKQV